MAEDKPAKQPVLWSGSPFGDFRKQMDDLVESFFGNSEGKGMTGFPGFTGNGALSPAIDISENDDHLTMTAELPGMSEDDVELVVRDGVLTLKGEKKFEQKQEKEDTHVMERRYGSFQRVMTLPDRVDEAKIKARFDKGVLTVTMPKKAEAKAAARKIAIG